MALSQDHQDLYFVTEGEPRLYNRDSLQYESICLHGFYVALSQAFP